MDSMLRYLDMLSVIPKAPESIATPDLLAKLQAQGYQVDLRTIQRDLNKLSRSPLFPISSTEGSKPLRWFWPQQIPKVQFPLMTSSEALMFKLVDTYLDPVVPPVVKSALSDYVHQAENILQKSPLGTWTDKVKIIPNSMRLLPAEIQPDALMIVYEGLLKNVQINILYHPLDRDSRSYLINPLGLVCRHNVMYLVAMDTKDSVVKQFALHRFENASLTEISSNKPTGFSLDDYINQGEFDYPVYDTHPTLSLKLAINRYLKQILQETPLSTHQIITATEDEDTFILESPVIDSEQLRWWIKSFGSAVEVLEPEELRAEMIEESKALRRMYR